MSLDYLDNPHAVRDALREMRPSARALRLREAIQSEKRVVSVEQARLTTEAYRDHPDAPRVLQRAHALAHTMHRIAIRIRADELIVGNRTPESRAGVVFPEAAVEWVACELESLPTRPQDRFEVAPATARIFREEILPAWRGRTLEDIVYARFDDEIVEAFDVAKINQRDHAQGHIIPNVRKWLETGPAGLAEDARRRLANPSDRARPFYEAVVIVLDAASDFMRRYADLAEAQSDRIADAPRIAATCRAVAERPPQTFLEAVQSVWFLFALLHMESNASSFSPGRLDQALMPYLAADLEAGRIAPADALEIVECFWIKCNEIVYMRNAHSARYFAGFPIGFNICIGGRDADGRDQTNALSYLCLKAQADLGLPQPNLSARLHAASPPEFLEEVSRVIGLGSGMPQVFNDESVVPALEHSGIPRGDAADYGVIGCVELSAQGNMLGWSDAAMFNLVKALELALNDGVCMLSGRRMGPPTGTLADFRSLEDVERALDKQVDHFMAVMMRACDIVDRAHAEVLPSPLLSAVVEDCLEKGTDVTAGGARHNLSGIQCIQVANIADSLAALEELVFATPDIAPRRLLDALRNDFADDEPLRHRLLAEAPKYGNDIEWVDALGAKWAEAFARKLDAYTNARGGRCHAGFYTVSAHVPMGLNVAATPDGRHARAPLADGGLSPVYGRDRRGPTAALRSVSRIPFQLAGNGTLLNMKFLPSMFEGEQDIQNFVAFLRTFVALGIHHVQFNVVNADDLEDARTHPEKWRHLTVRVAGYTAYFTELDDVLQEEIIARTAHGKT